MTVYDLRLHLNVADANDDVLLQSLLDAATVRIGQFVTPMPTGEAPDLDLAIKQLVAHWYEFREGALVGASPHEIPEGVHDLITPYRQWAF